MTRIRFRFSDLASISEHLPPVRLRPADPRMGKRPAIGDVIVVQYALQPAARDKGELPQ
jgi:hypothetical protein